MDESTIEVIERPSTPAEARLHYEIEELKRTVADLSSRVVSLELRRLLDRRPGDD